MNYDFLSFGDKARAKNIALQRKNCQRSFVNWQKMHQKNTAASPIL